MCLETRNRPLIERCDTLLVFFLRSKLSGHKCWFKCVFFFLFFLNRHLFTDSSLYAQRLSVLDTVRMDSRRPDLFLLVPVISLMMKAEANSIFYIPSDGGSLL